MEDIIDIEIQIIFSNNKNFIENIFLKNKEASTIRLNN